MKINGKYWYLINFIWHNQGKQSSWYKVYQTKTGVSFYKAIIENNIVSWEYDETIKGKKVDDYIGTLDYNPNIHDKMIINDMSKYKPQNK